MNTKITVRKIVFITIILISANNFAQLSVPFKIRYQGFVKGDMTIIANNSVNRVDNTNGANKPYNLISSDKLNDEFDMDYIDIDEDESTFSSSSAELYFDNSNRKKIVYAGLYWSGTYPYNVGIKKGKNKFIPKDASRATFSSVKLKAPNQESYIEVSGQVLFDGAGKKEFDAIAPYAVYADITDYVKELSNASGVYTVANVKATQGKIEGGVSAGWTIFIVYEDQNMSGKFVTSFDGFAGVTDKSTNIVINGFQTLPEGNVSAKIACATLEGDNKLTGDQLLFSTNESKFFSPLSTNTRSQNNFFNSSITTENQNFINRYPDSMNTLGFDTCMFTIPNPDNKVIGNNIKEATLRLRSTGDRFFMFFTAFGVEVTTPKEEVIYVSNEQNPFIVETNNSNEQIAVFNKKETPNPKELSNNEFNNKDLFKVNHVTIPNEPKGYYIVANVFSVKKNAANFVNSLQAEGLYPNVLFNPINNYDYVYLRKVDDEYEAQSLLLSKMNNTYQERLWILSVNNNSLVTERDDKIQISANNKINNEQVAAINKKAELSNNEINSKDLLDVQHVTIPNEAKGYYIVANVFAVKKNAANFVNSLQAEGLYPNVLLNPTNKYDYVYLKRVDDELEAQSLLLSNMNNTYQERLWILSVNNNSLVTERDETKEDKIQISDNNKINYEQVADINKKGERSNNEINRNELFDVQQVIIPNLVKGFYIVANVFAVKKNSINFVNSLQAEGLNPNVLINPSNNYDYVYLKRVDNEYEAQSLLLSKMYNTYEERLWILSVNNNNSLITNNEN